MREDDIAETLDHSREFEREFTDVAMSLEASGLPAWQAILDDPDRPLQERLKAFCVLSTFHRRHRTVGECFKLHQQYGELFKDTFFYNHLHAIALKDRGRRSDIETAVLSARKALALAPDNIGAMHNLAGALYRSAEAQDFKAADCQKVLTEALDFVEEALCIEKYGRFYSTKAQILSAKGLPDLASDAIRDAIEHEDSNKTDYHLRLSDYFSVRSQIELRRRIREATDYADATIQAALEEGRRSNIEILSFFVAAVSFIVAGINIMVKFQAAEIAGLIFIIGAALLLSISGFSLFYSGAKALRRFSILVGIAIGMTGFGLLVRWLWSGDAF